MARSGTERTSRRAFSEALLAERLGLKDFWIERCEENGTWREKSCAPDRLPQFILERLKKDEIKEVEEKVDQLVAAGCQRSVIYFCLEQLSPASEWLRSGGFVKSVQDRSGEDLHDLKQVKRPATREDMATVAGSARSARKQIHRYKHDLSLAAEAFGSNLPAGFSTKTANPEDALLLLESGLTWVARLAEAYAAPMMSTMMKSKGLLYITIYVTHHADARKLRAPRVRSVIADSKKAKNDLRAKGTDLPAGNVLANLMSKILGADDSWSASELKDKVESFRQHHPQLHKHLCQKLAELHAFASR